MTTPTGGTYKIKFGPDETADIPYNASAIDITAALVAAGINDVVATSKMDDPAGITIIFTGAKTDKHQPDVTIDAT